MESFRLVNYIYIIFRTSEMYKFIKAINEARKTTKAGS